MLRLLFFSWKKWSKVALRVILIIFEVKIFNLLWYLFRVYELNWPLCPSPTLSSHILLLILYLLTYKTVTSFMDDTLPMYLRHEIPLNEGERIGRRSHQVRVLVRREKGLEGDGRRRQHRRVVIRHDVGHRLWWKLSI